MNSLVAQDFLLVGPMISPLMSYLAEPEDQRDIQSPSGLLSALGAPQHTFDGGDLIPDVLTKAAVLMRSLIVNHPFYNGNKRTAVIAAVRPRYLRG